LVGVSLICLQASGVCIHAHDLAYRLLDHGNKTNSMGQPGFGCAGDGDVTDPGNETQKVPGAKPCGDYHRVDGGGSFTTGKHRAYGYGHGRTL
jgi:hypothetical protein